MKRISVYMSILLLMSTVALANETVPVSFRLPFENLDFLGEDWVERTGLKTVEDRKWELVEGKFGKALYLGAVPLKYDNDNMSGLDLDMVTAVVFNVAYAGSKGRGYDEPFIWGAGKLHPGCGAVAFWTKGSSKPEDEDARTILFEQTTASWGRKERQLIEIELHRDRTITAYVEDARYVQHAVATDKVWKDDSWNHIVFMWNKVSGISLWINGREVAATDNDAWWENQRPGLFHFPMAQAAYDEFYIFSRTLTKKEIADLYKKNIPPESGFAVTSASMETPDNLKNAYITDTSSLPAVRPSEGGALVFHDITPVRIHDEGIQGWWIADGRYELAWPHEYSIFTIIPGDVDFHAEKADILPPKASTINYITFEGNLDGVSVYKGDREGGFGSSPVVNVPVTDAFFYGAAVKGLGDSEIRIPFTKSYGAPPGFESDGDVLRLPLSGNLRLHEVGLFHVYEDDVSLRPGHRTMQVNTRPQALNGDRYAAALDACFCRRDRNTAGLYQSPLRDEWSRIDIAPMSRYHFISEASAGKYCFDTIVADLWIMSPTEDNVVQFRLYDPAVPSHTWTHAEMRLEGFTDSPKRLRVALKFDPAFLVSGDRVWLEVMATDGLAVFSGRERFNSSVSVLPEVDWTGAEPAYSLKTMRPNILVYGRSFEYIPWEWDKRLPDVDAPESFGGMFDMAYPWQAVLKVAPGDRIANIYKAYATGEYDRGRWPKDMNNLPDKHFTAPDNAPDWAVYFREFQSFRGQIVTWWRHHQRSDGQAGGGWNDDTLIFSRSFGDMPLDSNKDALALYNNVFDGFDKTNYFKDGYCRIHPIDRLHNGDFVRERYKSLVYNLGDPRCAVWAMEEAWHWEKPDQTPVNYGDGRAFLFGKDVMEWYWGKQEQLEPYRMNDKKELVETLRKAAILTDEAMLWRRTEAWCHTDDQSQYGASSLFDILLGGWGRSLRPTTSQYDNSNFSITVGVGWPDGGGPQLGRLVEYSGDDGLTVQLYSFDRFDRAVTARLFRIRDGNYRVSLRSDPDGDGTYDTVVMDEERHLRRFALLEMSVPSRVPARLEVKQISADPDPGDLPDLATSDHFITVEGTTVKVTIFNIGSAPSGDFKVNVYCPSGGNLKTVTVDSIPGSTDFVPQKANIVISDLPSRSGYTVVVDEDNGIKEIFDENNTASVITGNF